MRCARYRIIMTVCAVFLIAGCGKNDNNINNINSSPDNHAVTWKADYSQLENPYVLALATNLIYGCYVKDDQILLDIINKQDISTKETLTISNAVVIMGMASDQEGNVYLMGNSGESMGLWRIDNEGKLQDYAEMELENTEGT